MSDVTPGLSKRGFECPHCRAFANMTWCTVGTQYVSTAYDFATCKHCDDISIWNRNTRKMVYPNKLLAPMPNDDMPDECKQDFMEAREIAGNSPRGAAALLRLCLQRLMPHVGGKGKNLNEDIAYLVKNGLSPKVQQALDYVRVLGNEAVHPGEITLEDDQETVNSLFKLINYVVENRITQPKEIDLMFQSLPERAKASVVKRDS